METITSSAGMVVAPHMAAANAGAEVLKDAGTAVDAMIATAATVAVVYPHMNAIGGRLLVDRAEGQGSLVCRGLRSRRGEGLDCRLSQGGMRNCSDTWSACSSDGARHHRWMGEGARNRDASWGGLPMAVLLEDATRRAREGISVSRSQFALTTEKRHELENQSGFADI